VNRLLRIYRADKSIVKDRVINPEYSLNAKATYGVLKRIYRRMQMRSVRMMQIARKGKHSSSLLYRAYTWEEACRMIEREMEVLECQIKKIKQT
jgi:hypothetical protein